MVENLPASAEAAGDVDSVPGGHGNPHQYSCLENSRRLGATVHAVAELDTTARPSTHAQTI